MNSDLILVIGLVLGVLAVPAILSALSERRSLRVAAVVLILAAGLVVWAAQKKPGGYSLSDVPQAFVRVIGDLLH